MRVVSFISTNSDGLAKTKCPLCGALHCYATKPKLITSEDTTKIQLLWECSCGVEIVTPTIVPVVEVLV